MNQGIVAAILSILLYLSSLLSGGQSQPIRPVDPPLQQQSYIVLGQIGTVLADRVTVRHSPNPDGRPLGTVMRNTTITILDQSDTWYKIRPSIGAEGWVPDYAITIAKVQRPADKQELLAFYPGGEWAYDSLLANGTKLTGIAPLGWRLDSYGGLIANFDPEEMGRSLFFAGNQEMDTYANIDINASPSRLLSTSHLRQNSIAQLRKILEEWGLKGVLFNIAYVPADEQTELFGFMEQVASSLRQEGIKTIVALPWDSTIDYAGAAEAVDYIVLESAPVAVSKPGPIADITRVETMLQAVTPLVPPEKIVLVVSTGGRHWSRTGLPSPLSHTDGLELAAREGASVRWDTSSKTPYFQYGGGNEVWFENRYSIKYKIDLVQEYDLGGLALRDLGQEDSAIWSIL